MSHPLSAPLDAIPYARLLGVQLEATADGWDCVLPFHPDLVGNATLPAIHGGVLGSFLELTALLKAIDASESSERTRVPRPINFSIDYLRSAGPATTRARAEIFRLGRRIANVHVIAWQDEISRPVAAGNGKFLLA